MIYEHNHDLSQKTLQKHQLECEEATETKTQACAGKFTHEFREQGTELTPVTAVPAQAQAKGRRYHGDFAMKNKPSA